MIVLKDYNAGPVHIDPDVGGVIMCDIDGTIADLSHRIHHVLKAPKNWDAFFSKCADDAPIRDNVDAVVALYNAGWRVLYCTGRNESLRAVTERWLDDHGLPDGPVYMRGDNDRRHDTTVKAELLEQIVADGYDPTLILEDRERVVQMWRSLGLFTVQVAEGRF